MSTAQTPDEPSMEEILASIRRIISEQDSASEKLDDQERQIAEAEASDANTEPSFADVAATDTAAVDGDDVLELSVEAIVTDHAPNTAVTSFDEELASLANEEQAEANDALNALLGKDAETDDAAALSPAEISNDPEPDFGAAEPPMPEPDIEPEPTSAPEPEESDAILDEAVEALSVAETIPEEHDAAISDTALPEEPYTDEPEAVPMPETQTEPVEESLVSEATAAATAAALSSLSNAISQQPVSRGMTIEELVREMMRPMMKEWLDANLPTMVEKAVKTEIERIVRNAFKQTL